MTTKQTESVTEIISVKGFDRKLQCRGFQFEVGKTYTAEGKIVACRNGFHAVDAANPFYVWDFYPVIGEDGSINRYAEVVQSGAISREDDEAKRGTKIASGSITIKAELSLPDFIRRAVNALVEATKGEGKGGNASSGDYAQIGSSGDYAQIGSSGDYAQIGSSGDYAQIGSSGNSARIGSSGDSARIGSSGDSARIGSSGDYAQIGSSGDYAQIGSSGNSARIGSSGYSAQIGSSGYSAQIGSSGYSAQIGSSGDYARIGSSGDYAQIGSSGNSARIDASGYDGVIASAGINARVKGKAGTWVSVAEFETDQSPPKCIGFATGKIGEDDIPADTWLIAKGGKLVAE